MSVWDTPCRIHTYTRPDLMEKIAPRISRGERYGLMVEKRR